MNYHLHRDGQTVGVFPLEELRRRREAGELSGNDLVWREGMPSWQTLDSILQSGEPAAPPSVQARRATSTGRRALIWGLSLAAVLFVAGLVAVWVVATVETAQRIQQVANQRSGNDSVGVGRKPVSGSTHQP